VYAQAWSEGQSLPLEAAIAEALAVEVAPAIAEPGFGNLTRAEVQVLRFLVDGSTTKEIASQLVVAVSTVDRHITHIYSKLGVRNRAEATAVALKHNLVQNRTS
jgi:DNA-binding NarL/FixJ family response regulator